MNDKTISVLDLVAAIGVDNLKFQRLDQCLTKSKSVKGGTELSFETSEDIMDVTPPFGQAKRFGIVLWCDSAVWDGAVTKLKEA
ncbi:hypothetical protein D3C85_794940 [compost metagenome]